MTKLKDVAAYLGLSVSTVSRVLNHRDRIAPETRERVENAIRELNYQPDEIARRLKQNSSDVLGVVVPDISNPFFADVVRGAQRAADEAGFLALLCDTNSSPEMEKKSVSLLMRHKVIGIVSASVASGREAMDIYSQYRNIVFLDNIPQMDRDYSSVTINNYLAAKELVGRLIEKGYRKIGIIAGPKSESSAADRLCGYLDALVDHGLEKNSDFIRYGDYRSLSGSEQMKALLALKERPTAVFAANNFMAYGAMQAIMQSGLAVPDDIAIATFDVSDSTGLLKNRFLYVEQPAFQIGYMAAQMCIREKSEKEPANCCRMLLHYTIR